MTGPRSSTTDQGKLPTTPKPGAEAERQPGDATDRPRQIPGERGGPAGPEPTRYGDWEKGGRCFDF